MNHLQSRRTSSRRSMRKILIPLSLAVVCGLFADVTQAQWVVSDPILEAAVPTNSAAVIATQASTASAVLKQIDQYEQQVAQYAKQVEQYQAIVTSIQGLASGGISLMPSTLQPITNPSTLVQQSCPGAGGGGLMGDLSSIVTTAFSNSITTSQENICAQIVITQVDKYNKTIKVIGDMKRFSDALMGLTNQIGKVTNQGDSDRVSANAATQNHQVATDMADWDSQMKADDAIISTLSQQQSILAKVAMKGSNTPLGNVIQAATFVAAFN